jgi:hypothetical protein
MFLCTFTFLIGGWPLFSILDAHLFLYGVWWIGERKRHFEELAKLRLPHSVFGSLMKQKHDVQVTNGTTE